MLEVGKKMEKLEDIRRDKGCNLHQIIVLKVNLKITKNQVKV